MKQLPRNPRLFDLKDRARSRGVSWPTMLPAPEMVFTEGEFLTAHDAIRKIVKMSTDPNFILNTLPNT